MTEAHGGPPKTQPASDASHAPPGAPPARPQSSRTRPAWQRRLAAFFWCAVLLVIAILGLGPGRKHTMLSDSIQTAGHFVAFGVLGLATTWGARAFLPATRGWRLLAATLGLVVAILAGGFVEVAQKMLPGRDASWSDLAKDAQGAVAALCLLGLADLFRRPESASAATRSATTRATAFRWPAAIVLFATLAWFLVLGLKPTVECVWDYWQRGATRSDLMPLDEPWVQRFLWSDEGVRMTAVPTPDTWPLWDAPRAAELTIQPGDGFPGFGMREVAPDWSHHRTFVFEVRNLTGESLEVGFRIHDIHHDNDYYDRFNTSLQLLPGDQTIRIDLAEVEKGPRRRRMDLRQIEGFKIMALRPPRELQLVVGGFRLE